MCIRDRAHAVKGIEYNQEISYELSGTNKDNADVTVEVNPSDIGISAKVQDNKVILSGKPSKAGTVDIILTASAQGDNTVTDNIQLKINEPLTVTIEGQLDCVTQGQSGYTDYLDVYVTAVSYTHLAQAAASLIIGICTRFFIHETDEKITASSKINRTSIADSFVLSVSDSSTGILSACAYIVLFSAILNILNACGIIPAIVDFITPSLLKLGVPYASINALLPAIFEVTEG